MLFDLKWKLIFIYDKLKAINIFHKEKTWLKNVLLKRRLEFINSSFYL